jgi:hypothetical protein
MNAANTAQTPFGGHIAGTIGPGDDGHPDKNCDNSRGSLADRAHLSKKWRTAPKMYHQWREWRRRFRIFDFQPHL